MDRRKEHASLDCPSAQPDMAEARILGVITETAEGTRVAYLNAVQKVTPHVLELTGDIKPTRVMRFAAKCEEARCTHFDGRDCQLASRIVGRMSAVSAALPPCSIRRTCRWHSQEGAEACFRCPQIVTYNTEPPEGLPDVAFPAR